MADRVLSTVNSPDLVQSAVDGTRHLDSADPELRCRELIESLSHPDIADDERNRLVLEAETLLFRGARACEITSLMWRFIEDHRDSDDPADLIAVGSAIRTYLATAPVDQACADAARLLETDGRGPIAIELEIEVAKMVVRKLTTNPPPQRDKYAQLALRLDEIADAYARPRLLFRAKYGAVAINAIIGLILTRSGRDEHFIDQVMNHNVRWFQELLARRAMRIRYEMFSRNPQAVPADIAQSLEQLSELTSSPIAS
jgi:hypothetical protein